MISIAPIIMLLVYLLIIGFIIYFLINVLQFTRRKNHHDELLLQKMDEISKKLDERKEK